MWLNIIGPNHVHLISCQIFGISSVTCDAVRQSVLNIFEPYFKGFLAWLQYYILHGEKHFLLEFMLKTQRHRKPIQNDLCKTVKCNEPEHLKNLSPKLNSIFCGWEITRYHSSQSEIQTNESFRSTSFHSS